MHGVIFRKSFVFIKIAQILHTGSNVYFGNFLADYKIAHLNTQANMAQEPHVRICSNDVTSGGSLAEVLLRNSKLPNTPSTDISTAATRTKVINTSKHIAAEK